MSETKTILFGPPRLERDGQPVNVNRRKGMAMLAYLAVTGQTHSRDSLATLFWPEQSQSSARGNLRRALSDLNREIGGGILLFEGENVALVDDAVWSDVVRFRDCLNACLSHGHPSEETCEKCIPLLDEAVSLYRADFLAGFTLRDTIKFDDWQYFEAEGLRQEFATALERLVAGLSERGDYEAAILYARRWVSIDPLHEPAQLALIKLYHQAGQSSPAIRQYDLYVELVEKEIGEPPTQEMTALYEKIRSARKPGGEKMVVGRQEALKPINNLPIQSTPFLGREKELEEITQLLTDTPECRLVTLVGPGGIGKTRLSMQAGSRAGDAFRDGTVFVPLASVTETGFIVSAIAESIQFNFQGNVEPKKQLLHHLSQKNYLLILDNFEQLLGDRNGEELISEVLQGSPQLKLIVSSRERLHIQEEWVFDVQGMPFPQEAVVPGIEAQMLEKYSAVQLFIQSAQKAKSDFDILKDDLASVIRICQLVGGMPLAIELAAPWVRMMTCREIADEIERSFDVLETSLRNVPERHRSIRAVLEQTWSQLTPEQKNVLSRLSLFRGGCSRQAAEVVTGAPLALLSSLVDKTLLRGSDGRYGIHELIRQFAFEQLQKDPESYEQTLNDYYRYYSAFLAKQVDGLKGGPQLGTVRLITADIDNVRAAWQFAVGKKDLQAIERSAEGLFLYSEMSGRLVEAESAFRQAVTTLENSESQNMDAAIHERVIGYLLVLQGVMASHTGNRNGLEITKRGIDLVRRQTGGGSREDKYRMAFCLMWLGWTSFLPGFYEEAERHLEEALNTFREMDEKWGVAKSLFMISNADIAQGYLIKAEQALRKSLSICREIQDSRSRVFVNRTLGIVTLWFGDLPLTQQLLEEAVQLSHEFNDLLGLENTLRELGKLQTARGEFQLAEKTLMQGIEICHEIGAHWEGELAYCDLGALYRVQEDYNAAQQALQRGLDAAITTKNRWWHPRCLAELGCVAGARKDYSQAEQLLLEALNLWKQLRHEPFYAWGLAQLGHVKIEQNTKPAKEARQIYKQGLELAVKHGQSPIVLNIFVGLAKLLVNGNEQKQAVDLLDLAVHHPTGYFETKERARKLLNELNVELPSRSKKENHQAMDWKALATEMIEKLSN